MSSPKLAVVNQLRDMMPTNRLTLGEAYLLAERQAAEALKLLGVTEAPIDVACIGELPRIEVKLEPRHRLPSLGGFSQTRGGDKWVIVVNQSDPPGRRRFTLAHEFKHVLDDLVSEGAYAGLGYGDDALKARQIESICDHFAACLLMPHAVIRKLWKGGIRDIDLLATGFFNVSTAAMIVRLRYLGYIAEPPRPLRAYFRMVAGDPGDDLRPSPELDWSGLPS